MSEINIKIRSNVVFSDASADAMFNPDAVFYGGFITTTVKTTDPDIEFDTNEVIDQSTDDNAGKVTITVKITTSDTSVLIETQPVANDYGIVFNTSGAEETIDGKLVTTLTTIATKNDKECSVFCTTTVDKVTNDVTEPDYRYVIVRQSLVDGMLHGTGGGDYNMTCQEMYSLMNFTCVKLSEGLYQTLRANWWEEEIIELDADTAVNGTQFFSEIRPVGKVWEAKTIWYGDKIPTQITPEIVAQILTVMNTFAVKIIEAEYERRYYSMRNVSNIEADSWAIQKEEAKEWLAFQGADGHVTPLLDYMATTKGIDKTVLANKILEKAEAFQDRFSRMLVEMQELIAKFKACTTVKAINILYEDYFGIATPISQAVELGRTISEEDHNRKPEWRVKGNGYYF